MTTETLSDAGPWHDRMQQLRALVDDLAPAEIDAMLLFATERHRNAYARSEPMRPVDTSGLAGSLRAVADDLNREGVRRYRTGDVRFAAFESLAWADSHLQGILARARVAARG